MILAGKKSLRIDWYSFLGHECFFNAIVSRLIALKALKSEKFGGFCTLKAHQGSALEPKL